MPWGLNKASTTRRSAIGVEEPVRLQRISRGHDTSDTRHHQRVVSFVSFGKCFSASTWMNWRPRRTSPAGCGSPLRLPGGAAGRLVEPYRAPAAMGNLPQACDPVELRLERVPGPSGHPVIVHRPRRDATRFPSSAMAITVANQESGPQGLGRDRLFAV
jgi:hypothetical protein